MAEGDRVSRPNSLLLEGTPPEREPLKFDVQLVGAPPEVEQLVNNIKHVAEDFLYHWKTFPIVLPPSNFNGPGAHLSDIIIAPPCDELDAAALDAGLEPHPLSPKQLHQIRDKGEFEVPSRHFPGQTHVWRVAGWLQRGRLRAKEDLYCLLAQAAALVVVVARDRVVKDETLSVIAGAKCMLGGLHRLVDIIFGMPSLEARDLDKKIREERSRYLVAELICKAENQEDISALAAWVTRAMRRAAAEKADARETPRLAPPVPFAYTTPQNTQIDLRLYRRELLRRAAPSLQQILERESRGWFLHFRERLAAELHNQKVPAKDIEQEVRSAGMREYVQRVCAGVLTSSELRALGEGIPELLAAQLHATVIVNRAEDSVRQRLEEGLATLAKARLTAEHPVLSRAESWRKEKLAAAALTLSDALRWTALEDAAAAMQAHKLHQHRYLLLRDLTFRRDREPLLIKELRAAKTPSREFSWATRIWLPRQWVVVRHFRGRAQRIPTVLSTRPTNIVTPRSDPSQPVFLVDKERVRTTATRWPGWRIMNTAHRSWCWSWNLMFLLGVMVPWCSPLSLRTLLCVSPYVPDYELSQVNGTLFPKRSSETQTMWSRLLTLWRHVSKERTRFETEPDTGLLGKGLSRQANCAWNYGVIGGLGSIGLLLLFPVACLATCVLSILAALLVPLWVPPLTIALHAVHALVYDMDSPRETLNRWFVLLEVLIWRIAVLGILQPIVALLVAAILCPLAALLLLIGGMSWWCLRSLWEAVAFRALISRAGRVPAHESPFCRRVAGPGVHSPAIYQITAAQALAAICARAECEVLSVWARAAEAAIDKPLRDYRHFVAACFGPFSVHIAKTGPYRQLEKECAELTASLRDKVATRRRELALNLSDGAKARLRITPQDLKLAVQAGARELSRMLANTSMGDEWWSSRGLSVGDWSALAATTLLEVFDVDMLDATSARQQLDSGAGPRRWQTLCNVQHAPPDVLAEQSDGAWCEWGSTSAPRVPPPSLDVGAFSPRAPLHPPLPPPPAVALVLFNRESDSPVPLDSELCADILKTLEDAPDCDERREGVERYRGGGSEDSSEGTIDDLDGAPRDDPPSCRVSPSPSRAACRWTLTGRGVRLRADLASPEDVTLDTDRPQIGTSV